VVEDLARGPFSDFSGQRPAFRETRNPWWTPKLYGPGNLGLSSDSTPGTPFLGITSPSTSYPISGAIGPFHVGASSSR